MTQATLGGFAVPFGSTDHNGDASPRIYDATGVQVGSVRGPWPDSDTAKLAAVLAYAPEMLLALRYVSGKLGSFHDAESDDAEMHIIADIEARLSPILDHLDRAALPESLAPAENGPDGRCIHCGRDNRGHEGEPCSDDCPLYWEARGIAHPESPIPSAPAPTVETLLAAALAAICDLFERGGWQDDGSFVYSPDDSDPDDQGAIGTLGAILAGNPAPTGEADLTAFRLALIEELNDGATVEGCDDMTSMIRRALRASTVADANELRAEYGLAEC